MHTQTRCHLLWLISLCVSITQTFADGFKYPATMPPPHDAQLAMIMTFDTFLAAYETPLAIRFTSTIIDTFWECVAVYHDSAFSSITRARPSVLADAASRTKADKDRAKTRMLCGAYASAIVSKHLMPESSDTLNGLLTGFGLDASYASVNEAVALCSLSDTNCRQAAAAASNFEPSVMASIVATSIIAWVDTDGWNADGTMGVDGSSCTANCNPYDDYTGYAPNMTDPFSWKPLEENNGKGFYYHYDHVTPHIGTEGRPRIYTRGVLDSKTAPDPAYDYAAEVQLVIERLATLAEDDRQKMLVEYFDNKLLVGASLMLNMEVNLGWTWEERQFFLLGMTSAEYDSVLLAWKEKIVYDRIRPTTLIKQKGLEQIETYGGPYAGKATIDAKDFESFIRVMPHAEYPSGSGCICKAIGTFADALLQNNYGRDSIPMVLPLPIPGLNAFPKGSSSSEPGTTPQSDLMITMANMTEMYETCGQSRLWGGMHFTASIQGSYDLCDGLGEEAYNVITSLLDGKPLLSGELEDTTTDVPQPAVVTGDMKSTNADDKQSKEADSDDEDSAETERIVYLVIIGVLAVCLCVLLVITVRDKMLKKQFE